MATSTKDFAPLSVDPQAHILPNAVNQQIFDDTIIPAELSHLKDAGHLEDGVQPIAILIAGYAQPLLHPDLTTRLTV